MQFVEDEDTGSPFQSVIGRWHPVVETLVRPIDQAVATDPQGDCDDFEMYAAAHLLARGVPCSFVTVAANEQTPDEYSHVYLAAYPQDGPRAGRRVPLDFSHGPRLDWETENVFGKRREWPIATGAQCYETAAPILLILAALAAGILCLYKAQQRKGD